MIFMVASYFIDFVIVKWLVPYKRNKLAEFKGIQWNWHTFAAGAAEVPNQGTQSLLSEERGDPFRRLTQLDFLFRFTREEWCENVSHLRCQKSDTVNLLWSLDFFLI